MYLLKSAEIIGLWGRRDVRFEFSPKINFLVGPNGSGKTAVIRLIAATLGGDIKTLKNDPFTAITIEIGSGDQLHTIHAGRDSTIFDKNAVILSIDGVKIKPNSGLASIFEEQSSETDVIKSKLRDLINLTWLNIYRDKVTEARNLAHGFETPPLDRTVHMLSDSLWRYFLEVNARADAEITAFVSFVFANLLPERLEASEPLDNDPISWKEDQKAFERILSSFRIDDELTKKRTNAFFQRTRKARRLSKEMGHNSQPGDIDDALALAYSFTIHKIVQKWHEVDAKRIEIFSAQRLFERSITSLFHPKLARVDEQGSLAVYTENFGSRLPLLDLSSGEKQMLLILGEALLQRKRPSVYLADEPELSLHISWQEQLVDRISRINPNAQIIFATHSPDIIGKNREMIFDLRESK